MQVIEFYIVSDEYGEFSNFAKYQILLDDKRWPTSEHYFQAQKFENAEYKEAIRKADTPMIAARLGRDRKQELRKDWKSAKVGVMRNAIFAKFTQHEELKKLLISTGNAKIIEHTQNDDYWADGGDGSGKNMLGKLLMELRETLIADSP
jgi:ribA/ribD-fused uncharacterized protein